MLYINDQPVNGSISTAQVQINFRWHKIAVVVTPEPFTPAENIQDRQEGATVHYSVDPKPLRTFQDETSYYTWLPLNYSYVENTEYKTYYEKTQSIMPE